MEVKYVLILKDGTTAECYSMEEVWNEHAGNILSFKMFYYYDGEWVEATEYAKMTGLDY